MSVLLGATELVQRRAEWSPDLAALAASLRRDLAPLLSTPVVWFPREKARLTRRGGRCRTDGTLLDFDPWSPHAHRCGQCGTVYTDDEDYRWWIMGYQLWLAERAVHGAALAALTDDAACRLLAIAILDGAAEHYLHYPNVDNVLGPTRPFFSTYLESIWVLQLAVALDLLESTAPPDALGARVRERVLEPSAALIASYDEGDSNRQVWNNAALVALGRQLQRSDLVERALAGPSGLTHALSHGLLSDGTWYEGENYHLFAHRGLWYGVAMAEHAGVPLPPALNERFGRGFATPFATALPDFTFPSRRDSPYRVSLRQWRMAESCELGIARGREQEALRQALGRMYDPTVAPGDSGRSRSTAEAERNVPSVRLTRADLSWKSLLFARANGAGPPGGEGEPVVHSPISILHSPPSSVLLPDQGFAVQRRREGGVYVALDYGHSGAGHGHPDRLNLWLVIGDTRVLEDVGTGSYVDPSLHWYRSTLAHNAPLVDGVSQPRVDGQLIAWDDQGDYGWTVAAAELAQGVVVERCVIVAADHVVDVVRWRANREVPFDLPMHTSGELALSAGAVWRGDELTGGMDAEDGFPFVSHSATAPARSGDTLETEGARAWFDTPLGAEWWRARAPGPPGSAPRDFLLLRTRSARGCIRSVWSWSPAVTAVRFARASVRVERAAAPAVVHEEEGSRWRANDGARQVQLSGHMAQRGQPGTPEAPTERAAPVPQVVPRIIGHTDAPLRFHLGREHYRRSEPTWEEADCPTADVSLSATRDALCIAVRVDKPVPVFAVAREENPLDNEHPDINSDGVQLHISIPEVGHHVWLFVPEGEAGRVRVSRRHGSAADTTRDFEPSAQWDLAPGGWSMTIRLPRRLDQDLPVTHFRLDVIVNEIAPGRERRRGQLVLSGGSDWIYLRGDRQSPAHFLPFVIADE